jgi:hypothetical protein
MADNVVFNLARLKETDGHCDLFDTEKRILSSFAMMIARQKAHPTYLEVGIFGGGTINFVRSMVAESGRKLQCTGVDLFEDFRIVGDNTHVTGTYLMADVQEYLGSDIRLIKGNSDDVLPALKSAGEKFDMIFVDGNHTYEGCKRDYENSLELLADDGYIAFHNSSGFHHPDWTIYNRTDGGPWQVVTELKIASEMRLAYEVDRVAVFTRPRASDASIVSPMKALEDENRRLKKMYAETSVQVERLKEALGEK